MYDLHSHILPGIDDGPKTLGDSLDLLRAQVEDGVTHLVVTPHIYPGVFDNTWAGIAAAFNQFQEHVDRAELPISISFAAEVRLCAEMLDWLRSGDLPVFSGEDGSSVAVLVELPDGVVPVGAEALLTQLVRQGVTPIIAHPERNRAIMETPAKAAALVALGCKLQVTAASLLGDFGERAQATANVLLHSNMVELVASDAHNLRSRRPRMGAARTLLAQAYGEETATRLTVDNPKALAGATLSNISGPLGLRLRDLPRRFRPNQKASATTQTSAFFTLKDMPETDAATSAVVSPMPAGAEAPEMPSFRISEPMPMSEPASRPASGPASAAPTASFAAGRLSEATPNAWLLPPLRTFEPPALPIDSQAPMAPVDALDTDFAETLPMSMGSVPQLDPWVKERAAPAESEPAAADQWSADPLPAQIAAAPELTDAVRPERAPEAPDPADALDVLGKKSEEGHASSESALPSCSEPISQPVEDDHQCKACTAESHKDEPVEVAPLVVYEPLSDQPSPKRTWLQWLLRWFNLKRTSTKAASAAEVVEAKEVPAVVELVERIPEVESASAPSSKGASVTAVATAMIAEVDPPISVPAELMSSESVNRSEEGNASPAKHPDSASRERPRDPAAPAQPSGYRLAQFDPVLDRRQAKL